jgi:hypothetical protein
MLTNVDHIKINEAFMCATDKLFRQNKRQAKLRWGLLLGTAAFDALRTFSHEFQLSIASGDLFFLDKGWYVTNSGLTRLARRNQCAGIHVQPVPEFSDSAASRWAFKATVYKSRACKGFVGYGDADPSNVSPLVHGAEMRVAETRAVNRALRKAYGIGICSVEEIGSFQVSGEPVSVVKKLPSQSADRNSSNGQPKLRDRLCQLIRQHQLDSVLVKAYAADFCGVKSLHEATREQVENFVDHLADWAEKDRNALLCQLNSYLGTKEVGTPNKKKENVAGAA